MYYYYATQLPHHSAISGKFGSKNSNFGHQGAKNTMFGRKKCNFLYMTATEMVQTLKLGGIACWSRIQHQQIWNWPLGGQKCNFWSVAATEIVKTWKLGRITCLKNPSLNIFLHCQPLWFYSFSSVRRIKFNLQYNGTTFGHLEFFDRLITVISQLPVL